MSLTDVQNKRDTYFQAIDDYQQALLDFDEGTIDQSQLDAAQQDAVDKGKTYADEMGATSTESGVTEDDLYTDTSKITQARRDTVVEAMWTGTISAT